MRGVLVAASERSTPSDFRHTLGLLLPERGQALTHHHAVGSRPTTDPRGDPMKKAILAVAATAAIAAGTMSAPTAANAGCYGCGVGAGVAGGLIAGAIIGGAIANSQPRYYAPAPGYVVYGGYG